MELLQKEIQPLIQVHLQERVCQEMLKRVMRLSAAVLI